ncbi:chemotaxis protein CheB [Nocardia otitidiscaviarum]|nr:chemotaxis protein CheB [Nocardia otitidiscaviarum]
MCRTPPTHRFPSALDTAAGTDRRCPAEVFVPWSARQPDGHDRIVDTAAPSTSNFDVVAVAASAGGPAALIHVVGSLPADLPVPVLLVQHLDPRHPTLLADILTRRSRLPVRLVCGGERIEPGTVYLAPPAHHMRVGPCGQLLLSDEEPVHFVRPSADVLFESVADHYGPRAIACVLTGSGNDGAAGAKEVRNRGGTVIVEDPNEARFDGMPTAAIAAGAADLVLPLGDIPAAIRRLVEVRPE